MNFVAIFFSLYLCCMACLPCTDTVMDRHEHIPSMMDAADTTGSSAFHDDTCPVLCGCGCCATSTTTPEPELIGFRIFVIPQTKPIVYPNPQVLNVAFSWWHPPRAIV